jgi:CRP/FNR family transcriptional regulator, cyclic AMP receptor protein
LASTANVSIQGSCPVTPMTKAARFAYGPVYDWGARRVRGGLVSISEEQSVTDRLTTPLLELDADLGQLLPADRLAAAKRELRVAVRTVEAGLWDVDRLSGASPEHLGLLVVEGIIAREVLVSDTVSTELLGPGDVVRPWRIQDGGGLLQHTIRWNVLSRSRLALLDRRLGAELGRYPEVGAAIVDRVNERALRLAVTQAISQLNRVDRRLLALFWHLAERWGRMTSGGVALPMTLSHRMLGQLVGARRPTVSTALGELVREGELARRDDGTWLLTGEPVGIPAHEVERVIPIRRRLLPPEPAARVAAVRRSATVVALPDTRTAPPTAEAMTAALKRVREQCASQVEEMRSVFTTTSLLAERTSELRQRCRETRGVAESGSGG